MVSRVRKSQNEAISFVQIGANDGLLYDPYVFVCTRNVVVFMLHACGGSLSPVILSSANAARWRGVLVEPVPRHFERLQQTYAQFRGQFRFINAAISVTCAHPYVSFFVVNPDSLEQSHWLNGIGSLSIPNSRKTENIYSEITVQCMTIDELARIVDAHGIRRPDLLVIDVEGHDHELVQSLGHWPFGRPLLLLFELWGHDQLPADAEPTTNAFLAAHQYHVCVADEDRIAFDTRRSHELL